MIQKTLIGSLVIVLIFTMWINNCWSNLNKELQEQISSLTESIEVERDISEQLDKENKLLAEEVVLRQDLTSLIVDAARSYNLDPMLLAKVIKSESNFRPNPKHTLPHITGPGGINTKAHSKLKHNPNSYVGNIYASAEVLSYYLEDSDSLILALTRYKGLSPLGLSQAKSILKEYKNENSLLSTP